jgi:hypothetical protein
MSHDEPIAPCNAEHPPTLVRWISNCLIARGYGGLYNVAGNCTCRLGDLFPCRAPRADCTAGYLHRRPEGAEPPFVITDSRTPPRDPDATR